MKKTISMTSESANMEPSSPRSSAPSISIDLNKPITPNKRIPVVKSRVETKREQAQSQSASPGNNSGLTNL